MQTGVSGAQKLSTLEEETGLTTAAEEVKMASVAEKVEQTTVVVGEEPVLVALLAAVLVL